EALALAKRAGLAAGFGPLPLDRLDVTLLPAILMVGTDHAIVVERRIGRGRYAVHDPRLGRESVEMDQDDLAAGYAGHALIFRRSLRGDPVAPRRGHWFWSAFRDSRWLYLQVVLAAAVANLLGLTTSIFTMTVYDRILPNGAVESLLALTAGVMIALVFDFLIRSLRAAFVDRAGMRADLAIGGAIFDRLLDIRLEDRPGSSGALAGTLREFETLRDFFTSATLIAIVDLPFVLLFLFVVHLVGGPLVLVPAVAVPTVLVVGLAVQPFLARGAERAFAEGQTRQGVLVETLSGLDTIKTAGAARVMRARWETAMERQAVQGLATRAFAQFALNATVLVQQAAQVCLVFYGVFLVEAGSVSAGALIASVILTGRALAPLAQIAQTLTRANQARSAWRALHGLMQRPTEREEGRAYLARPPVRGEVELRDVVFAYPGQEGQALNGVSFRIAPGEKVAIIGRIGSGKSTVARLLSGLYAPQQGAVLVDGVDIRQIDPGELRHGMGVVLQDVWLFSGSVRDNIAAGAAHASDDEVRDAARLSGADSFIAQHPQGYGLMLGERGEALSGGQKQQIALARALIGAPPLLVLDEPTSALDLQGEQALVRRLREGTAGQTLVVVTHRSALLDLVDRVIVLENGKIVADGPRGRAAAPSLRLAEGGDGGRG
ncbi:type I secretion system permease/ATPase, partial [Cereibacter changlensis]